MTEDLFYKSLFDAIEDFYNNSFMDNGFGEIRNNHLRLLQIHYDRSRFENCDDLNVERDKFLTEIHNAAHDCLPI